MELCSILRISINEFLAGEDIGTENVIEKSDSNLIQITKESKKKQKNLKTILAVVTVFAVIVEYYGSNVPLFRRNGYRQSGVMIP